MTFEPLGVIVYPHAMEIGGSQLNAVELAAAVAARGHRVAVYSEDGPLVDRVHELGLPHLMRHDTRRRPSLARAAHLARAARTHRASILHAYEWPPILEAWAASGERVRLAPVGTVMSMAVAPFLPARVPLVVGTERIARSVGRRTGALHVIEPPVDTEHNRPGSGGGTFAAEHPLPSGTLRVVVVCRLVPELKLEGVLTAVRAVRFLQATTRLHLTIVGDGAAREEVARAAAQANAGLPMPCVTLTGELSDPRPAYDAADVALGMGGSALRALAFGVPLVVQGEGGFFELLEPASLHRFLDQGFYGRSDLDPAAARESLAGILRGLAADSGRRRDLGVWGRSLVEERFSLSAAAARQESIYRAALAELPTRAGWAADGIAAAPTFARHTVGRRVQRARRGAQEVARDDFNARPA